MVERIVEKEGQCSAPSSLRGEVWILGLVRSGHIPIRAQSQLVLAQKGSDLPFIRHPLASPSSIVSIDLGMQVQCLVRVR